MLHLTLLVIITTLVAQHKSAFYATATYSMLMTEELKWLWEDDKMHCLWSAEVQHWCDTHLFTLKDH